MCYNGLDTHLSALRGHMGEKQGRGEMLDVQKKGGPWDHLIGMAVEYRSPAAPKRRTGKVVGASTRTLRIVDDRTGGIRTRPVGEVGIRRLGPRGGRGKWTPITEIDG